MRTIIENRAGLTQLNKNCSYLINPLLKEKNIFKNKPLKIFYNQANEKSEFIQSLLKEFCGCEYL